jgi:P-type Ca2+ transporter type 2C
MLFRQQHSSHDEPLKHLAVHAISTADLLGRLATDPPRGLPEVETSERLSRFGPNILPEVPPRSALLRLLDQFTSLLIIVLIIAAALAAFVGNHKDATIILAVVVLNALLGFYQEHRAEQSLAALRSMLPSRAKVRRGGTVSEISAEQLVPGDVVLMEAGDRVPADGRLTQAVALAVDESSLTGESIPAQKDAEVLPPEDAPIAERPNSLFMNTLVARGRCEMVVTQTGAETVVGRISKELEKTKEGPSPLQVQLDMLGKRLGAVALTLVALLGFLEYLRSLNMAHAVLDAIALSVAAVPEGLPAVVTVTLALGMRHMAQQRAIVKRLASVETLGSTTVICSDKTGTLTLNQMTVRAFQFLGQRFAVTGEGYEAKGEIRPEVEGLPEVDFRPLLTPLVLCNDSALRDGAVIGDPMEAALLVLGLKGGVEREALLRHQPRVAEIPFDAAHKFMATFHRNGDIIHVYIKGAPDVLLSRCERELLSDGELSLSTAARAKIEQSYKALAAQGLRGLLIASRSIPAHDFDSQRDLHDFVSALALVGLIGLMDPARPEVKGAIAQCKLAGIRIKMITGDHKDTALAIARELGIEGEPITGAELDSIDALSLAERIENIGVFARVAPEHKVKIVRALKANGHVVAMTGDGVNDAPALKAADIGIAMGMSGTAVSKEAASMVLTDDNFASIVNAIRQGRTLYDNIIKFLRFQLSTTVGAVLTVFFAPLAGLPEPFTPLQILWVAMIMDGPPAVSLALDAARPGLMHEPPRPRDLPLLPFYRVAKIIGFGMTMMVGTLLVLHYGLRIGEPARATTLAFTTFVLFQFFNVFNARVEGGSAFNSRFFSNRMLWWCLGGIVILQVLVMTWAPAAAVFDLRSLSIGDWLIAAGVASTIILLEEGRKLGLRLLRALRIAFSGTSGRLS